MKPAVEPVTIKLCKDWARFESDQDDELFKLILTAARKRLENYLGISMMTQTIRVTYFNYQESIPLLYGPVQSITSVKRKYKDTEYTMTLNDDYYLRGSCPGLHQEIHPNVIWETSVGKVPYEYVVTYVVGYGSEREDVPEELRLALLDLVANAHENRNSTEIFLSRRIKEKVKDYRQDWI